MKVPKLKKKQHDPKRVDRGGLVAALFHQELGLDREPVEQPQRAAQQQREEESPCSANDTTSSS